MASHTCEGMHTIVVCVSFFPRTILLDNMWMAILYEGGQSLWRRGIAFQERMERRGMHGKTS